MTESAPAPAPFVILASGVRRTYGDSVACGHVHRGVAPVPVRR
jgi:hypothetical protein